jgi:hypothetical protein
MVSFLIGLMQLPFIQTGKSDTLIWMLEVYAIP